jgi:hypothetical protein
MDITIEKTAVVIMKLSEDEAIWLKSSNQNGPRDETSEHSEMRSNLWNKLDKVMPGGVDFN